MPRPYTITDLVLRCQQRSDMEGDPAIAPDEWVRLLSEAYGELYTVVVHSGMQHFERVLRLTTTGAQTVGEPIDHMSTVQVLYLLDASTLRYVALRELMAQERPTISSLALGGGAFAKAFALVDRLLYLYPTPPAGQVYELRYAPQPPDLEDVPASTPIDIVMPDGLAFLIWNVVVMAAAKTEVDATLATMRLEAARERFTQAVQLRALLAPRRRILDIETDTADSMWADRIFW